MSMVRKLLYLLMITLGMLLLSGCPPIAQIEICNNSGSTIYFKGDEEQEVSQGSSLDLALPLHYVIEGFTLSIEINNKSQSYFIKSNDKNFFHNPDFRGLMRIQLNREGYLYLLSSNSSKCPERIPPQPSGWPVYVTEEDVSNEMTLSP